MQLKFFMTTKSILTEGRAKDEMSTQLIAFQRLMHGRKNTGLELALIKQFGAEFRKTLDEFKNKYKSIPTPDDLIWLAGVHANKDPMHIAKELAQKLGLK